MANSVYDKIIEKGTLEAEEIRRQGEEKANNISKILKEEVEEKIKQLINDAKTKNEEIVKTSLASFEQNKKQSVLLNQKQLIKTTFDEVLNHLLNLKDDELKLFVCKYLEETTISSNDKIRVNQNDFPRYQKLFSSKRNNELDLLSKALNIKDTKILLDDEKANIKGGFIVIGKFFDIDNSFEAILDNLEGRLETVVSQMLFEKREKL